MIQVGVDDGFRARAREALVPGTSAVALLLSGEDQDEDLGPLRAHGGSLIVASLSSEQEAELEREFGGHA